MRVYKVNSIFTLSLFTTKYILTGYSLYHSETLQKNTNWNYTLAMSGPTLEEVNNEYTAEPLELAKYVGRSIMPCIGSILADLNDTYSILAAVAVVALLYLYYRSRQLKKEKRKKSKSKKSKY